MEALKVKKHLLKRHLKFKTTISVKTVIRCLHSVNYSALCILDTVQQEWALVFSWICFGSSRLGSSSSCRNKANLLESKSGRI